MTSPTPPRPRVHPPATAYLRRDTETRSNNSRLVLIGVFVFFLLLLAFVLVLVFTIGIHNSGVKEPPSGPKPRITQTG